MMARQKEAKKHSFHGVNAHFEPGFNAVSAALGIDRCFLKLLTNSGFTRGTLTTRS
jgi:hypothetical protein